MLPRFGLKTSFPHDNFCPQVSGGFAEKMLKKMGWKDGDGLGKMKAGVTEPIKFR